jgi:hypothetical protein
MRVEIIALPLVGSKTLLPKFEFDFRQVEIVDVSDALEVFFIR